MYVYLRVITITKQMISYIELQFSLQILQKIRTIKNYRSILFIYRLSHASKKNRDTEKLPNWFQLCFLD